MVSEMDGFQGQTVQDMVESIGHVSEVLHHGNNCLFFSISTRVAGMEPLYNSFSNDVKNNIDFAMSEVIAFLWFALTISSVCLHNTCCSL